MEIFNCEQKSPEWLKCRELCMTASNALTIATNGVGLNTYILKLVSEYFSNGEKVNYINEDIERGNELEEFAREIYELETGSTVKQVGFIKLSKYIGASPDGLVGEDGLIEIKSKADIGHFKLLLGGINEIEKGYIAQMQMQMYVTGRQWCDFISYNPNYEKSLIIHRIYPDEAFIFKLKQGLVIGEAKIKELINKYELCTKQK